ncbi:FUSC family membrane protein, partial [Klebsiella pneumoniae]|uniref:FUSC family membrane protein n=1 Tax=Klebsiella pneumoniae TaxID=573 RepID=UPI00210E0EC0
LLNRLGNGRGGGKINHYLKLYFLAQDLHERVSSSHYPYQALALDSAGLPAEPAASLCFSVLHGAQPLRFNADSMPALALPLADGDIHAWWLGVPLSSSEGVIGVLLLKSTAAPYTEKDQELLQFVSVQVVTAIERKQLYARLHRMAQYDELTGLPNRACFRDRLDT